MAARQQQQLDSQHQLLSAREQRLHFLKQSGSGSVGLGGGPDGAVPPGGAPGAAPGAAPPTAADVERLRRLHERVDAQEQKLRKLRALRGQVDGKKLSNAALSEYLH